MPLLLLDACTPDYIRGLTGPFSAFEREAFSYGEPPFNAPSILTTPSIW